MKLLVDRSDYGFHGTFDGQYAGLQRTGILLGVVINRREVNCDIKNPNLDEIEIFEFFFPLFFNIRLKFTDNYYEKQVLTQNNGEILTINNDLDRKRVPKQLLIIQ